MAQKVNYTTERNLLHMFRSKQEPCSSPDCLAGPKCPRAHSICDWCPPVWLNYKHNKCFERWSDETASEIAEKNGFVFKQTPAEWIAANSEYHRKKARDIVKAFISFSGSSKCDFVYDDQGKLVGSAPPVRVEPLPVAEPVLVIEVDSRQGPSACREKDETEVELEQAALEYERRCEMIRKRAVLRKEKAELLKKVNEWRERARVVLPDNELIM